MSQSAALGGRSDACPRIYAIHDKACLQMARRESVSPAFPASQRCTAAHLAISRAQEGLGLSPAPAMTQEPQRIMSGARDQMARIPCGSG
ncbi:MAG TPA: hypothetical protein VMI52_09260 [Acetobacteraceae bacterium]|nr:hypothetical protein [Acetobacteraceae bacterium]